MIRLDFAAYSYQATVMKSLNLTLALLSLEPKLSTEHVILGTLSIARVPFHVMLVEVIEPNLAIAVGDGQDLIDAVARADEGVNYQTVSYRGKPYFIIIHPFQA